MTPEELKVLDLTADVWNAYQKLPVMHPDDLNDIKFHIHAIQNILYAREGVRSDKGAYNEQANAE